MFQELFFSSDVKVNCDNVTLGYLILKTNILVKRKLYLLLFNVFLPAN